jgi:hypothetical protein
VEKSELPGIASDKVVVRVFINGQYVATCNLIDAYRSPNTPVVGQGTVVIDADLEVFEMEKK